MTQLEVILKLKIKRKSCRYYKKNWPILKDASHATILQSGLSFI